MPILWTLLGLPLLCAALAFRAKSDKLRTGLIVFCALAVTACGVAAVLIPGNAPDNVFQLSIPAKLEWIGGLLELLMIGVILAIAIRIRNFWIILMGVAQLAMAAAMHFIPGAGGHEEIVLFRIDNLARILLAVTTVVGSTILVFSIGYMKRHAHHAPEGAGSLGRFFFFFIAFLGFMSGLVISENLSWFSFFWEATTLCSYALIGQDGGDARRINAVRALLINSFGGTLLILGVMLVKIQTGGESFSELLSGHGVMLLPALLLCVAAFTKSALFPFQSWLLGAMVAPTPVSAMLHAATMVKAGVYLVLRITPGFHDERAMMVVAFAGALTFVGGALLACTQSNAKKVLAYSTISNLGLVVACAGMNTPLAYAAGLAIITFHAISKGLLFLCVGNIEQKIGSRDIEAMDGMLFKMPFTTCVALLGMMSMLLPPFGMLLSKWLAIEATIRTPSLLVFLVLGSALTVFFWAKWIGRMQNTGYHESFPQEEIEPSVRWALTILSVLILITGGSTMWIFKSFFSPMADAVFHGRDIDWRAFHDIGNFYYPAFLLYGVLALSLLLYYFVFWRRFNTKSVRRPYLCGENVSFEELKKGGDIRSYDFHSLEDKTEHAVISSVYFRGIVNETIVSRCLSWIAWLIIIVMIGSTIHSF